MTLQTLLTTLSQEQRAQLRLAGISDQLRSDWLKGRRLPTEVQVVDVAAVTGAEWAELQKEITIMRAPEERREQVARILNRRKL